MKETLNKIEELYQQFKTDADKASIEIEKLLKKFRKESLGA